MQVLKLKPEGVLCQVETMLLNRSAAELSDWKVTATLWKPTPGTGFCCGLGVPNQNRLFCQTPIPNSRPPNSVLGASLSVLSAAPELVAVG